MEATQGEFSHLSFTGKMHVCLFVRIRAYPRRATHATHLPNCAKSHYIFLSSEKYVKTPCVAASAGQWNFLPGGRSFASGCSAEGKEGSCLGLGFFPAKEKEREKALIGGGGGEVSDSTITVNVIPYNFDLPLCRRIPSPKTFSPFFLPLPTRKIFLLSPPQNLLLDPFSFLPPPIPGKSD